METRVFGTAGPSKRAKEDLAKLIELPNEELDALAAWILKHQASTPDTWSDFEPLKQALSSDPRQTVSLVGLLRFVMSNWAAEDLSLEQLVGDLKSLGYEGEQLKKAERFFAAVEPAKKTVYLEFTKEAYQRVGLPTIDDVNLIWDIRPIFADFCYSNDLTTDKYQQLLGFTSLLILEIQASSSGGEKTISESFQLSESDLQRILDSLQRAQKQLEVVRESTRILDEDKEPK